MLSLETHSWCAFPKASDGACRSRVVGWGQHKKGGRLNSVVSWRTEEMLHAVQNGTVLSTYEVFKSSWLNTQWWCFCCG